MVAERAQRRLAQLTADRVDGDVGPTIGELTDPGLEVLGRVVDHAVRAPLDAQLQLLVGRGRGDHLRAERPGDIQRGQSHAARRAEHEHPRVGADRRAAGEREPRGRVALGHGRGLSVAEPVGDAGELPGREHDLVRVAAEPDAGHDPVTHGDAVDLGADLGDLAGDLAARHERQGRSDLVAALYEQGIDEVHAAGPDVHPHLAGPARRGVELADLQVLRLGEGITDDGAHVRTVPNPR